MRKRVLALIAIGLLAGPFGSIAHAGVICDAQEKLGVNNIKECEDHLP